jgi:NTE family protein
MTDAPSPPRRSRFAEMARRVRDAVTPADTGSVKTINLALQGGGAYGAFTWGVLDGLLADERIDFEAISGTSAGAMNAVVLADGLMRDGADGARAQLAEFWRGVSRAGVGGGATADAMRSMLGFWDMPGFSPLAFFERFAGVNSPYRSNPLNINPLRTLLEGLVDFDRVRANDALKLFVSATNVRNGKIRVFSGDEITADAILASACLPILFQAVEIGDEAYWDGGYMGNPALFPFFTETECTDILLVQINPVHRQEVPKTAQAIMERVAEITFNASLLREFRAIDFVNRLIDDNRLDPKRYKRNRLHRIDATEALAKYASSSKLDTSWRFFEELHEAGEAAARDWLAAHYADIGVRATLDLRAEFG